MSERRAKQVRRLLILAGLLAPRPKRPKRKAPEPSLIGWTNDTRAEYDAARWERH